MSDLKRILWSDSARRTATVISVLFLIACIGYLLVVHSMGLETEVIRDRYWKNAVPLFNGELPVMEYPPLALVFIAVPYVFGSTPWGYETAYVAEVFLFMVIGLLAVSRLAGTFGCDRRKPMIAYAVLTLLMLEFVLDRFDIFVMVITLISFLMLAERRYGWAYFLLAVGTLVKVYPAVLFPLYLIYTIQGGQIRGAVRGTVIFVATGAAVMALFWLIDPDSVTNFLQYNTGRPLQIESFASSVIYAISSTGLFDVWIQGSSAESFWSDNLRGPVPDAVSDMMVPLMVVCVILVWAAYMLKARGCEPDPRHLELAILACLAVFLLSNKVFSAQYVIWLIGPVVLLMMLSEDRGSKMLMHAMVLCILLTQVNFAYNVGYLGGGAAIDGLGMTIILLRNLAVLFVAYAALRGVVRWPQAGGRFSSSAQVQSFK